jgi:hypothetical protein
MPQIGDAILVPSGPNNGQQHLFIILNNPAVFKGYGSMDHCVFVGISSIRASVPYDATYVLAPGDHPFVQRPSYIYYKGVRIEPAQQIDRLIAQKYFTLHATPFTQTQVFAVRAGFKTSPTINRAFKALFP